MKTLNAAASIFLLAGLSSPAFALTNYICQVNGKAVYTTERLNPSCQVSAMNGISEERASFADVINRPQPENGVLLYGRSDDGFVQSDESGADQINHIWSQEQFGSYDDVKIMPRAEETPPAPDLDVKLRQQKPAKTTRPAVRVPAPVIAPKAAPKPKPTRQQMLRREIASEQAALVRAQARLAKARAGGGDVKALEQNVRDRQANIRAIQGELNRR